LFSAPDRDRRRLSSPEPHISPGSQKNKTNLVQAKPRNPKDKLALPQWRLLGRLLLKKRMEALLQQPVFV